MGLSLSPLIKPRYAPPTPPSDSAVTVAIILVVSVSGSNQLYGTCLESYWFITRVKSLLDGCAYSWSAGVRAWGVLCMLINLLKSAAINNWTGYTPCC